MNPQVPHSFTWGYKYAAAPQLETQKAADVFDGEDYDRWIHEGTQRTGRPFTQAVLAGSFHNFQIYTNDAPGVGFVGDEGGGVAGTCRIVLGGVRGADRCRRLAVIEASRSPAPASARRREIGDLSGFFSEVNKFFGRQV